MEHNVHSYALIMRLHAGVPQVLFFPTSNGYSLYHHFTERHFWQDCAHLQQALGQATGLQAVTLRCVEIQDFPGKWRLLYAMEFISGELPPGAIWCSEWPALDMPYTAEQLTAWVANVITPHPNRPAWSNLGWYEQTIRALPEHLTLTGRVEMLRAWERSVILRLPAEGGDLYLKQLPAMFAHEAPLTHWLATHYPDHSPQVIQSAPALITRDYGGQPLSQITEVTLWEQAIAIHARLQIEWLEHTDELIALGVPVRGVDWIAAHLDALLHDNTALRCGVRPLDAVQLATVRDAIPRLHAACAALRDFPLGLEHGDLWSGQIIVREKQFIFTDWSDSAITCPLFSLPFFLAEIPNELPQEPAAVERLKAAYLHAWTAHTPDIAALYPHAALLSPLYTALRYYFDILPHMEQRWEMENMLTYNLRLLLKAL